MAASAFTLFPQAKKALGTGTIVLNSGTIKLCLVVSGATMLSTLSSATTWASLKTDGITELLSAGDYSSSGLALGTPTWTVSVGGGSAVCRFDAVDWSLSANGVNHQSIRACVIREDTGDNIICYATLSGSAFDILDGNRLIIQFNASGIFEMK